MEKGIQTLLSASQIVIRRESAFLGWSDELDDVVVANRQIFPSQRSRSRCEQQDTILNDIAISVDEEYLLQREEQSHFGNRLSVLAP